jgi:hypothetical protein
MKSSYLCLIGCVAALNFSVYSAQINKISTRTAFDGFRDNVSKILAESKKSDYKNAFEEAVKKVKEKRNQKEFESFPKWEDTTIVEWLISSDPKAWPIVPSKKNDIILRDKALKTMGYTSKDINDLRSGYYEYVIKKAFGGAEFADLKKSNKFSAGDKIDYKKMVEDANKGDLASLGALWAIYHNTASSTPFKKIVGSFSAFLAVVCENNDRKVDLAKIKNGMDVYKCLLTLGFEKFTNPDANEQQNMTFAKLLNSLPDFMEDLHSKGFITNVAKNKEQANEPNEKKNETATEKGGNGSQITLTQNQEQKKPEKLKGGKPGKKNEPTATTPKGTTTPNTPTPTVNMKKWGKK